MNDQDELSTLKQFENDPENQKDFHVAYLKLTQKIYEGSQENLLLSNTDLQKLSNRLSWSVTEFNKRSD